MSSLKTSVRLPQARLPPASVRADRWTPRRPSPACAPPSPLTTAHTPRCAHGPSSSVAFPVTRPPSLKSPNALPPLFNTPPHSQPPLPSFVLRYRLLPRRSLTKLRCAAVGGGTRTLCDITNLSKRVPAEEPEESTSAEGEVALLAKLRSPIYPNVGFISSAVSDFTAEEP
jgi:hypothetical protein